jgi:hypothetical protein
MMLLQEEVQVAKHTPESWDVSRQQTAVQSCADMIPDYLNDQLWPDFAGRMASTTGNFQSMPGGRFATITGGRFRDLADSRPKRMFSTQC